MNQMRHEADTEQLIPSIFFLLKKWESITWNREAGAMNWDQLEGKWKQYKGEVREKWGKLTDDDLHIIAGRREQLIGRLQDCQDVPTHFLRGYPMRLSRISCPGARDH